MSERRVKMPRGIVRPSRARQLAAHDVVRAGDDRRDVAREHRRGREAPGRRLAVDDGLGRRLVGDDLPAGGRGDGEAEGRLEVGLLEHREDAAAVGHLELRVEVDLVVDGVDEAVQALAGVRVLGVGDDLEHVLGGQVVELDAHAVVHGGGVERGAVQRDRVHGARDGVDERRGARRRGEAHGRRAAEDLGAAGQVELDVVRLHVDDALALLRLESGEVLSGHGCS